MFLVKFIMIFIKFYIKKNKYINPIIIITPKIIINIFIPSIHRSKLLLIRPMMYKDKEIDVLIITIFIIILIKSSDNCILYKKKLL